MKIRSRPATKEYRDNYDRLFRAAKDSREKRAEERQQDAPDGESSMYDTSRPAA